MSTSAACSYAVFFTECVKIDLTGNRSADHRAHLYCCGFAPISDDRSIRSSSIYCAFTIAIWLINRQPARRCFPKWFIVLLSTSPLTSPDVKRSRARYSNDVMNERNKIPRDDPHEKFRKVRQPRRWTYQFDVFVEFVSFIIVGIYINRIYESDRWKRKWRDRNGECDKRRAKRVNT